MIKRIKAEIHNRGFEELFIAVMNRVTIPFSKVAYWIFCFIPIDKHIIVFRTEIDYWDNGWALYDYLLKHDSNSNYQFIWLVKAPSMYNKIDHVRFVSFGGWGIHLSAYYYIARAQFIIYTHGMGLIPLFRRNGQTIINLCHGCAFKTPKGVAKPFTANFDYAVSISHFFNYPISVFLQCDKDRIIPLGYPRNDLLINSVSEGKDNPFANDMDISKVIIWMPTFRASKLYKLSEESCDNETGLPLLDKEYKIIDFNEVLRRKRVLVILKVHHLQAKKEIFTKHYSNIIIITDNEVIKKGCQLYQILGKSDALLTDYSSVATDYLLVNKPIGYIIDDIEKYKSDRGFSIENVESYMPGDHIVDFNQLVSFVDDIATGIDIHYKWRQNITKMMYENIDDNSCKRICEYFHII